MLTPKHVLIMTRDHAIRNLFEQLFMTRDIPFVMAASVQGAEAIIDLWGMQGFGLVIIDTAMLGEGEAEQRDVACRLLKAWTAKWPCLAVLLLGTLWQKHAVQMRRGGRFLVKPYRLGELVDAVDELYAGTPCAKEPLPHRGAQEG